MCEAVCGWCQCRIDQSVTVCVCLDMIQELVAGRDINAVEGRAAERLAKRFRARGLQPPSPIRRARNRYDARARRQR